MATVEPLGSGRIEPRELEQEMRSSFLDYAMSVIVARALPDVRDGLKPANRRVLFAMRQMGLASNRPYRKCAKIVGEVIGNAADGWVPLTTWSSRDDLDSRLGTFTSFFGRLKPGISAGEAQAGLTVLFQQLLAAERLDDVRHPGTSRHARSAR